MHPGNWTPAEGASLSEGFGRIDRIKKYVLEHLNANLGSAVVAEAFEISVSTLQHIFKKETGQNFQRFVETARMQKAIALLTTEDKIIKEVMSLTGYTTRSTFNRAFKRHFQKTPSFFMK